jgi:hypothetical protein
MLDRATEALSLEDVRTLRASFQGRLAALDPSVLSASMAGEVLREVVAMKRVLEAKELGLAKRVSDTGVVRTRGDARGTKWTARQLGVSAGEAGDKLDLAERLDELPATREALEAGKISLEQAAEIARTSAIDPSSEGELLAAAPRESLAELKRRGQQRRTAAEDDDARRHRLHANRRLSTWVDGEGAGRGSWSLPLESHVELLAAIAPQREHLFKEARRDGRRDAPEAYDADALVEVARDARAWQRRSRRLATRPRAAAAASDEQDRTDPSPATHGVDAGVGAGADAAGAAITESSDRAIAVAGLGDTDGADEPREIGADAAGRTTAEEVVGDRDGVDPTSRAEGSASIDPGADDPRPAPDRLHAALPRTDAGEHPPDARDDASIDDDDHLDRRPIGGDLRLVIRCDHTSLKRGYTEPGEVCEMTGVGPIPVAAIREWLNEDPFVAAVITDATDIRGVTHLGRRATALMRTALDWSNQGCSVLGCPNTRNLQIDHRVDWNETRHTRFDELDWLCAAHHRQKTHDGYRLEPGQGTRRFLSPDEQRAAGLPPPRTHPSVVRHPSASSADPPRPPDRARPTDRPEATDRSRPTDGPDATDPSGGVGPGRGDGVETEIGPEATERTTSEPNRGRGPEPAISSRARPARARPARHAPQQLSLEPPAA